jgi:hypothetical protein
MEIHPKTKLDDLLKSHPFLLDFLASYSSKFAKLRNPIMRRTVGRLATLGQVAGLGDIPVGTLLAAIAGEIRRVTGAEVKVAGETGAAAAAEPLRDKEARLEVLKDIIRDLHRGEDMKVLQDRFAALVKDVGPTEIAEMEQKLIDEGMPETEVKRLCDVHVRIFEESLATQACPQAPSGHPVEVLMAENRALESRLAEFERALAGLGTEGEIAPEVREQLSAEIAVLFEIEKHYLKKENQLFPLLESKGVGGPSKVMWAIHDDIRAHLKLLRRLVAESRTDDVRALGRQVALEIRDMITKEEKILFPMSLEVLDDRDWARVKHGEESIGYAWITPAAGWKPEKSYSEAELRPPQYRRHAAKIELDTGVLDPGVLNLILKHLPVEMSYIDEEDAVVFYSDTPERIFPRSPAVIGRKVQNCHPPASVHVVNKILEAFKSGAKDTADFWINYRGKFVVIRYLAVRDADGAYRGCLEITQDAAWIRSLQGEKRLLDWA